MRFILAHEVAFKRTRRFLNDEARLPVKFTKEVYKGAAKMGLINDLERWLDYADVRNNLVHTYSQALAEAMASQAQQFYPDVQVLLQRLGSAIGE
jgi:nucleotidyltransferase substrate binding protein (TIGR01987 family)